jgi:hypothetical protein
MSPRGSLPPALAYLEYANFYSMRQRSLAGGMAENAPAFRAADTASIKTRIVELT